MSKRKLSHLLVLAITVVFWGACREPIQKQYTESSYKVEDGWGRTTLDKTSKFPEFQTKTVNLVVKSEKLFLTETGTRLTRNPKRY